MDARIALYGFSRLGKTVLWAAAQDERLQAVFSGCAGEMGSALARRDWGETVDDMAQNFAWQFSRQLSAVARPLVGDAGRRAHADRADRAAPLFVTGGTGDQWSDPKGEFLAQVAAGPVYRLLGAKDLGVTELPPLEPALTGGDLGYDYQTGGHTATKGRKDWNVFLTFVGNILAKC